MDEPGRWSLPSPDSSADLVLEVTRAVTVPPVLRGVIWDYATLSFSMLFVYGYVERQYS